MNECIGPAFLGNDTRKIKDNIILGSLQICVIHIIYYNLGLPCLSRIMRKALKKSPI